MSRTVGCGQGAPPHWLERYHKRTYIHTGSLLAEGQVYLQLSLSCNCRQKHQVVLFFGLERLPATSDSSCPIKLTPEDDAPFGARVPALHVFVPLSSHHCRVSDATPEPRPRPRFSLSLFPLSGKSACMRCSIRVGSGLTRAFRRAILTPISSNILCCQLASIPKATVPSNRPHGWHRDCRTDYTRPVCIHRGMHDVFKTTSAWFHPSRVPRAFLRTTVQVPASVRERRWQGRPHTRHVRLRVPRAAPGIPFLPGHVALATEHVREN